MNQELFESLLDQEEGIQLDFKSDQYPFADSSKEEKSELLKDILAFANTWRTSPAYILIGVKEVKGAKSDVVGITKHLEDSNLQQFVGSKTQKPVVFSYSVFPYKGKEVGVIKIPASQKRPIYLKNDFGKLNKNTVYFRKGSSTAEATPDEIYDMGIKESKIHDSSQINFRLFDFHSNGKEESSITVISQPFSSQLSENRINNTFRSFFIYGVLFFWDNNKNKNFASEVIQYTVNDALLSPIGFQLKNTSQILVERVSFKGSIAKEDGLLICSSLPEIPDRFIRSEVADNDSYDAACTYVEVIENQNNFEVNIDFKNIRPGETVKTDLPIYVGSDISTIITIEGDLYGDNFSKALPYTFEVIIKAEEPRSMKMKDVRHSLSGI